MYEKVKTSQMGRVMQKGASAIAAQDERPPLEISGLAGSDDETYR